MVGRYWKTSVVQPVGLCGVPLEESSLVGLRETRGPLGFRMARLTPGKCTSIDRPIGPFGLLSE